MQRLMGLGRTWTKVRFCALQNPEKRCSGLSLLELPTRTYMARTSEILEKKLRQKDNIPEDFTIVYRGGMDWYIHSAYTISSICLVCGIWSLYYFFDSDEPLRFPLNSHWDRLIGIENFTQLFIIYSSFFAMVINVRNVSKKYVMRMYFNEKSQTFRAVYPGFIPTATATHDFKANTLHRITKRSIIPWWNSQYKCNAKNFLIFEEGFRTNADFDKMFAD